MFECIVTVPGGGNSPSKDGGPVKGPVGSFIKNYSKCYVVVKNHVLHCPKCCPNEALRRFLKTRDKPSLGGFTSGGLIKLVYDMESACLKGKAAPGKTIDPELVKTYIIRFGQPDNLMKNARRLDDEELIEALRWVWRRWEFERAKTPMSNYRLPRVHRRGLGIPQPVESHGARGKLTYWLVKAIGQVFEAGGSFPSMQDLEKLACVAEVMAS